LSLDFRAATKLQLGEFQLAREDAEVAISLDSTKVIKQNNIIISYDYAKN
jgi:hypothetical protein